MLITTKRTHVVMPEEVVREIDNLLGKRKRSQFLTEAAKKEIKRLNFLKALDETSGAWKEKDHPEYKKGVDIWVNNLRKESEKKRKEIL